jgi:hypothetical protein
MIRSLTPLLAILVSVGIFIYFIQPMYAEINGVQSETTEYGEAVAKAAEFNQLLNSLISKRNSITAGNLERLEVLVPDNIDPVRVLVDLEALAGRNNMIFGNVNIEEREAAGDDAGKNNPDAMDGSPIGEDDFVPIGISFSLIGSYEQFQSMLRDMERSLTLFELKNISLEASEGNLAQFNMEIEMYELTFISQ